ncbi:MAG: hypothetical protein CXX81_13995 [Methanobacteriota archaeon]|nr:MAG: hypothetical protein CXX81_13995 [Euryarchaeota archaeon]
MNSHEKIMRQASNQEKERVVIIWRCILEKRQRPSQRDGCGRYVASVTKKALLDHGGNRTKRWIQECPHTLEDGSRCKMRRSMTSAVIRVFCEHLDGEDFIQVAKEYVRKKNSEMNGVRE